tara:strand:+ start:1685 stop:3004 length:1320 start_codon:yes stop_codon:yes gene_type:complete
MKLVYHNSSTVTIVENDTRILCDPWILDGEYYGSWFHYPKFVIDSTIYECDAIYISHIHGDHLSENSLKRFNKKIPIYINHYKSPFVKIKLKLLGFENIIEVGHSQEVLIGDISLKIFSADNCNPEVCGKFIGCSKVEEDFEYTQIDSLALFKSIKTNQTILNLNDCPYDLASNVIKKHFCEKIIIDLLLVGYAGAGPYPQCFEFETEELKLNAANRKKKKFIDQAVNYIDLVKPKFYMPYAGTYILGGKNHDLNKYRGVPTRNEGLDLIESQIASDSQGFILKSNDEFDLNNLPDYNVYENPDAYSSQLKSYKYFYESLQIPVFSEIEELMNKAVIRYHSVRKKIKFNSEIPLIIDVLGSYFMIYNNKNKLKKIDLKILQSLDKYVKISMDSRLLKLCLMGPKYGHYDNAEIGSHIKYHRKPDTYNRALYYCLNFLHV